VSSLPVHCWGHVQGCAVGQCEQGPPFCAPCSSGLLVLMEGAWWKSTRGRDDDLLGFIPFVFVFFFSPVENRVNNFVEVL